MHDEPDTHPSWLTKLSQLFSHEPKTRKQLIEVLYHAKKNGLLDDDALRMIEGVLRVSEMKVRDVMIPRPQMAVVDQDATPSALLPMIIESAHSRYPVIGENRDEVIGILLAKDLLRYVHPDTPNDEGIKALTRPALFIPESKRLDVLLQEFRLNRNHMAIVVDEYGGVAGLVTIEDVLEQIVGNIEDEYDIEEGESNINAISDTEYHVNALTPIDAFNQYFKTHFSHQDVDTIGGIVLQAFSHLPKAGESITLGSLQMTVVMASNRRIKLLLVKRTSPPPPAGPTPTTASSRTDSSASTSTSSPSAASSRNAPSKQLQGENKASTPQPASDKSHPPRSSK